VVAPTSLLRNKNCSSARGGKFFTTSICRLLNGDGDDVARLEQGQVAVPQPAGR
jgi:hypothetical protein